LQFESQGLWVREGDLPSDPSEFSQQELDEVFDQQRLEEVMDDDPPTEVEMHKVASAALGQRIIER
jgi:hypothetical protein